MQQINNTTQLQTRNITTGSQTKIAKKEEAEPKDQVTLNSTYETPDFLQIPRKYKHSTIIPVQVRDYNTGEVFIQYYEKPGKVELFKENMSNGIKNVTSSVADSAKLGCALGYTASLSVFGDVIGPVIGAPAAILGGATGAIFGLLSAPFNGHGI